MYLECLDCPKLGTTCKGPNFVSMPANKLWDWCKKRKAKLRMTNAQLAELSGTPKGTIDRLFAKDQADFKYETIRPIIPVLVGGHFDDEAICRDPEIEQYEKETIKRLQEENAKLKETIEELRELKKEKKEEIEFLKSEVKSERNSKKILAVFLAIALSIIIGALVTDYMYSHVGFFWVDMASWFSDQAANNELLYHITE